MSYSDLFSTVKSSAVTILRGVRRLGDEDFTGKWIFPVGCARLSA